MHVTASKPARWERRCHLHLPVHALLAQDRDARARAARDERGRDVQVGIERQRDGQPGRGGVDPPFLLLVRAGRIVAQRLQGVGGLRPHGAQAGARLVEQDVGAATDHHALAARDRTADGVHRPAQTVTGQHLIDPWRIVGTHLHHGAQLFIEQRRQRRGARARQRPMSISRPARPRTPSPQRAHKPHRCDV